MRPVRSLVLAVVAILSLLAVAGARVERAEAVSPDLFFSEYVEGSSNNKALEIFNGTGAPVNLAAGGYAVTMHFNGNPSPGTTVNLSGTIAPGDVFVLAHSSADAAVLAQADQTSSASWFNGDDAVALRKGLTFVDVIGQAGLDPGAEWGTGLTSTADNTLRRKSSVLAGDTNEADAFDPASQWDGFATNTYDGLGSHTTGGGAPVTTSCGGPLTVLEGTSGSRTITASDTDGTVTSLAVAVTPATSGISTAVTPATAVGGTASALVTSASSLPAGSYVVTAGAANDDVPTPQTASCSFTLTVQDVKTIGEIQGAVAATDNPLTHRSPLIPTTGPNPVVFTEGVVTQKLVNRSSAGVTQFAIFLQSPDDADDGDPLSSDGIYVFMSRFPDLFRDDGIAGNYVPQVGHRIVLRATVSEFFNMTQLSSARLQRIVSTSATIPAPVELDLPADLTAANLEWERHEGEQMTVVKNSVALDGLDHFSGSEDGEIWLARPDTAIAMRTEPFARRAFRDAHPFDDLATLFDNGNGYRMLIGSHGIKTATTSGALLNPSRTFDTLQNELVGGVYFGFNKYQVMPAQQPQFAPGPDPSENAPPEAFDRAGAYSISDYNVENLYDLRDDPTDGCDFTGNAGCPGVNPPFNYVPADEATYQAHLSDLAGQIREDLHSPDILLIQEAEAQDRCSRTSAVQLDCGTAMNNPDGKPDTLQDLALTIEAQGGPAYEAAYDPDGADDRGIVSGFLYRSDRVELLPADASHPVLGDSPAVEYRGAPLAFNSQVQNPKALNADLPADVDLSTGFDGSNVFTRPPVVGLFRVWRAGIGRSVFTDVLAISNHFSSTPDRRVGQRTEQSNYLAEIVNAAPESRVDAGGDFNTFPRPDDPLNRVTTPHQLAALYDDAGMTNLYDPLVAEVPASAYSYVFVGMAQTLDGQFVSSKLADELEQARIAHVNADWPADTPGDGFRGASDHDPLVARFEGDVTLERLRALVDHYAATGDIRSAQVLRQLHDQLDKAQRGLDRGDGSYEAHVIAFSNIASDNTAKKVSELASEALSAEAARLR